jgi:hypothetical protein
MEALGAADLLDIWEQGSGANVHERALILLGAARPDLPPADLGTLPLGARDANLLRLRRATFGDRMAATLTCPACGGALEVDLDAGAIQPDLEPGPTDEPVRVEAEGRVVAIRPPATDDLIAALVAASEEGAGRDVVRRALLARLVTALPDGADGEPAAPSPGLEAAIAEALAKADPGLDLELDVTCPACDHGWGTTIDIADFLWSEIVAGGRRIADDVAGLAAAYGWREPDVLALTPWRRRLYLDLATP